MNVLKIRVKTMELVWTSSMITTALVRQDLMEQTVRRVSILIQ